jgi:hypothetical protein
MEIQHQSHRLLISLVHGRLSTLPRNTRSTWHMLMLILGPAIVSRIRQIPND